MSPLDAAIIRRKLGHIAESLESLRPIPDMHLDEYRAQFWRRKGAERVLQQAIESALDINAHLIAESGGEVPDDYFGGFIKVGDLGIVAPDLARQLAPSAGLRNRLVHEYDAIDDAKVLAGIATILELYPRYVQAVEGYLIKGGL